MPETIESTAYRFSTKFKNLHKCTTSVREGFRLGFLQGAQHLNGRLADIVMLARHNKLEGDWAHVHRLCMELSVDPTETSREENADD